MFAIGLTALLPAGPLSASIAAIPVTTITAGTDVEDGATGVGNTKPLPKNTIVMPASHSHRIRELDKQAAIMRGYSCFEWLIAYPSHRYEYKTPIANPDWGLLLFTEASSRGQRPGINLKILSESFSFAA